MRRTELRSICEWIKTVGSKLGDAELKVGTGAAQQLITHWMMQYYGETRSCMIGRDAPALAGRTPRCRISTDAQVGGTRDSESFNTPAWQICQLAK
jgi:hypothetical protein